jgi:hypothetical protein
METTFTLTGASGTMCSPPAWMEPSGCMTGRTGTCSWKIGCTSGATLQRLPGAKSALEGCLDEVVGVGGVACQPGCEGRELLEAAQGQRREFISSHTGARSLTLADGAEGIGVPEALGDQARLRAVDPVKAEPDGTARRHPAGVLAMCYCKGETVAKTAAP